ncbi:MULTISPECIES: hypothetical protein [unclassified Acinetobacter]|uniref:hypothetical protein n=1 Tax=unclassified Acinetobacter TaxID=196816 RepID=UPI00293513C5|nr:MULTISPECIES: hypothetical protein [unclassified Acinetobacter]WOE31993.1 hypothetical protein QSG84_01840 [Acinetobacter sp. SAAs470]WOE37461.1 hypothetical protein QSG86_10885 [Acinetobacter sp. SAAs474]
MYSINDLVKITALGCRLELNAKNYSTNDLIKIATLASSKGSRIMISLEERKLSVNEMMRIVSLGKGCVSFKDL